MSRDHYWPVGLQNYWRGENKALTMKRWNGQVSTPGPGNIGVIKKGHDTAIGEDWGGYYAPKTIEHIFQETDDSVQRVVEQVRKMRTIEQDDKVVCDVPKIPLRFFD
ncbi:MAG: hypothetical protein AAFR27_11955, partial [Pseudomonadota bacterium]